MTNQRPAELAEPRVGALSGKGRSDICVRRDAFPAPPQSNCSSGFPPSSSPSEFRREGYGSCRVADTSTRQFVTPSPPCDLSGFAFRYIRRRRSCRMIGAFVISPLRHLGLRNATPIRTLLSGRVLLHAIDSTATRSATLASMPTLLTRGYSQHLLGEIPSPDTEGFSN